MLRSVVTTLFALACLTTPAFAGSGGHVGFGHISHATHPVVRHGKPARVYAPAKNAVNIDAVCGPARALCEKALVIVADAGSVIYLVETGHAQHMRGEPGLLIDAARMDSHGPIKRIILKHDPRWFYYFMRYNQQFLEPTVDPPNNELN